MMVSLVNANNECLGDSIKFSLPSSLSFASTFEKIETMLGPSNCANPV